MKRPIVILSFAILLTSIASQSAFGGACKLKKQKDGVSRTPKCAVGFKNFSNTMCFFFAEHDDKQLLMLYYIKSFSPSMAVSASTPLVLDLEGGQSLSLLPAFDTAGKLHFTHHLTMTANQVWMVNKSDQDQFVGRALDVGHSAPGRLAAHRHE